MGKYKRKAHKRLRRGTKQFSYNTVSRRTTRSRSTVTKGSRAMYWHGSPFPREYVTQITYAENITITATTGAPNSYLYSMNGLYDPNISGTGGQPRYFDTLCGANNGTAPYYNYRVFASKISIAAMPATTTTDTLAMRGWLGLGLYNTTATGPATLAEMQARGDYKTKFINYWYASNSMAKMKRYAKPQHLFDIKDVKDDDGLQGDYTANPSKQGRWAITWVPFNETSTVTISVLVKIKYYVTFYNRNDVADS